MSDVYMNSSDSVQSSHHCGFTRAAGLFSYEALGSVVQSIITLTKSLVEEMFCQTVLTKSIAVLFLAEQL